MAPVTLTNDTVNDAKTLETASRIVLSSFDENSQCAPWLGRRAVELDALTSVPAQWLPPTLREKLTLDQSITDADRVKAMIESNATTDGAIVIKDRAGLKAALAAYAGGRKDPNLQHVIIRRATELGLRELLPPSWAGVDVTRPRPDAGVNLDEPASDVLGDPSRRTELDVTVRALAQATDTGYQEALARLQASEMAARERVGGSSLESVLKVAGVKDISGFQLDVKTLSQRDGVLVRQLDDALAPVNGQRLNERGQVLLDEDADLVSLLRDPLERERRWRKARQLDSSAYEDRARFDADDCLTLEGGADLVASLARPVALAQARQEADSVAYTLDAALDGADGPEGREKALQAAISGLPGGSTPDSAPLGQQEADVEAATHLSELTVKQLSSAMDHFIHGGRTLVDAVATAKVEHPDAKPSEATEPDDREALDERIRTVMLEQSLDYVGALEAVSGVTLGGSW